MSENTAGYISIENAEIGFRNFSGRANTFNAEGQRNFCVFIDHDFADQLAADGWNVRYPKNQDEDNSRKPFLQVAVKFDPFPPNIYMVTKSNGTTKLDEKSIGLLDDADIINVDVRIRPYHWKVSGKEGTKAYVKDMYVTVEEDPFAHKYVSPVDDDIPFN